MYVFYSMDYVVIPAAQDRKILRARNKSTILRYTAGRAMANVITRRPPAFTAVFRHISEPLTQVTQY
jgi:hypothetical protein